MARSSVEENEGKNELLKIIYSIYRKNIEDQIQIFKEKGRSLSWISSEIKFLVNQFVNMPNSGFGSNILEDKKIMEDIFGEIDGILYEKDDKRQLVSAGYIQGLNYVNMTESNMINAAEHLLKETQSDMSLCGLVNTITKTKNFASENLICDFEQSNLLHALALKGKSILSIDVNKDEKKIDISMENNEEKWCKIELINNDSFEHYNKVYIPKDETCVIKGLDTDELGVKTRLGVFLSLECETTKFVVEKLKLFDIDNSEIDKLAFRLFVSLIVNKQVTYLPKDKGMDLFEKNYHNRVERAILEHISDDIKEVLWNKVSREDLLSSIYSQKMTIYDLNDWSRRVSYPL